MAPQITDGTEIRIRVGKGQTLRIRGLVPKTNSDFVSTSTVGLRQDQGVLSKNSAAGISVSAFYVGASRVKSVGAGSNLFIKDSGHQAVVVVQLEDD